MGKKIVISSSMKFRSLVKATTKALENLGYTPLFPNLDHSPEDRDVALTIEEKNRLAWDHYRAVEEADAVYFILPKGYMGTSCKIELGYALALKKPIYYSEPTHDIGLDGYPKKFISLDKLIEFNEEFDRI
jgi:nucleoside 2-deoxyribosyltransferase